MKQSYLIFALFFVATICFGQVNHKKAFQVALEQDEVGKELSFDQSNDLAYDSLVLVYLGEIKTKKGQFLKILTSQWYWGVSKRATSRIIVFDQGNQYLGDYLLTMTYELPERIEGASLVFISGTESECTSNFVNKVSFQNGIPRSFFLKCKDGQGDIYKFAQNL